MKIKKTCLIKNRILMIAFIEKKYHINNGFFDDNTVCAYKIFVFDMVPDKTDVSGNILTGIDAIYPNFETLDYFYKNELSDQEFEKMFNLDWNFLKKTWEKVKE
jgi:hypothetical protein